MDVRRISEVDAGKFRRWLSLSLTTLIALSAATGTHGAEFDTVTSALPTVRPGEFSGDLSTLTRVDAGLAPRRERPYRPLLRPPIVAKSELAGAVAIEDKQASVGPKVAMPGPSQNFEGIARTDSCTGGQCGDGTPPDTNGDVGPNHYIQAVNSAYAIFNKAGTRLAAFTENQLWAGDASICSTESSGDPVVLYDALADRWILTHFAFGFSGADTVPPYIQCIAVSKTADPVAGGWWLYPVRVDDASHPWLNDYGKFGIWSDCLYMSANEFTGAGAFAGTLFASFSRADMYAGAPLTSSIGFITNTTDPFTMIPGNLGGQSGGALPAGTPNYFVSESQTAFAFEVRKFTAGPNCGAGGTLSSPVNVGQTSYSLWSDPVVPQPGTTIKLDAVGDRLMQKVQYRKVGAAESLWVVHSYRTSSSGNLGLQWAQIDVTGGTISTTATQQQKYSPDSTLYRFMPSLAVDRLGDMAVGYSTSGTTAPNYPGIAYSGRLAGDAANTLPQTETLLIAGGGSQTGNCGGSPCDRWGDYSAMSVDPADDCTFWITSEYYPGPPNPSTTAWHTRIGSFKFPGCAASDRTADLAITKSDGASTAIPGAPITYTIDVTNNGPFAVTGATVTDTIPAAITGVTWTCAASAGNSCPASGSGNINTSAVNLMKGGTATFTVQGTVSPSASGTLSNTAAVAVPAGFTDPVSGNNSATDADAVGGALSPPAIAKSFGASAIVVGQATVLTIIITNPNATTPLTGVAFSDALPMGISAPNATSAGCGGTVTVSSNVITLGAGTLAAGGNCSIAVTVTGANAQVAPWINTIAGVSSTQTGNNPSPANAAITVNKSATTTAIVSDNPHPSVVGTAVAIGIALSPVPPGSGTPTGTVAISDGVDGCTITLPASSCNWTPTTTGTRMVVATYSGDANFSGSVSPAKAHVVVSVAQQSTITVLRTGSGTGQVTSDDGQVVCGPTCSHTYANGTLVTLAAAPDTGMVFTGWLGACSGIATCQVTLNIDRSVTATFAPASIGTRILDIDNNLFYGATTDGLMVLRYLFGLTGAAVSAGAVGSNPQRFAPEAITAYLGDVAPLLDVDGNGQLDALTDGLLILRYLLNVRGAALTQSALGAGATRSTVQDVETYLAGLTP